MTNFSEIYDVFLNRITDYSILEITIDLREVVLRSLLNEALVKFHSYCKQDLFDIDEEQQRFNIKLDSIEIYILVENMTLAWIKRKRDTEEHTQNILGEKDYSIFSPANLLLAINKVYDTLDKDICVMMNEYSMSTFNPLDLMRNKNYE